MFKNKEYVSGLQGFSTKSTTRRNWASTEHIFETKQGIPYPRGAQFDEQLRLWYAAGSSGLFFSANSSAVTAELWELKTEKLLEGHNAKTQLKTYKDKLKDESNCILK